MTLVALSAFGLSNSCSANMRARFADRSGRRRNFESVLQVRIKRALGRVSFSDD
jgi:hypothetical protein